VKLHEKSTLDLTHIETTSPSAYKDAVTASIFFHDTEERRFNRGEKIQLKEQDIQQLEDKFKNRVNRSKQRK
jgi:hypothetical protein